MPEIIGYSLAVLLLVAIVLFVFGTGFVMVRWVIRALCGLVPTRRSNRLFCARPGCGRPARHRAIYCHHCGTPFAVARATASQKGRVGR